MFASEQRARLFAIELRNIQDKADDLARCGEMSNEAHRMAIDLAQALRHARSRMTATEEYDRAR
jgi:hypothetical protein